MKTADISRRKSLRAHTKLWRIVLAFAGLYATASNASDIVEYPIRTPNAQPMGISVGPDGKIWFAEAGVNKLGHVLSTGTIAETAIPEGNDVYDLALGPDSALWIAEPVHFAIGRWAPLAFDAFSLTTRTPTRSICAGGDGNMWFTEEAERIGFITPRAVVREFLVPTRGGSPFQIAASADGTLWFTDLSGAIGHSQLDGTMVEYPTPTRSSGPFGIVYGPDGNMWFTENAAGKIGRITPAGVITEFALAADSEPRGITAGVDGNLWFTEFARNKIGKITPAGTVSEYDVPTPAAGPNRITTALDGTLWFTEYNANAVASFTVSLPVRLEQFSVD